MRQMIKHMHKDGELRLVTRFLFLPLDLFVSKEQRTEYEMEEWRWLERADIIQRYSHLCKGWVHHEWAATGKEK